jgi:hypothetical protein
VIFYIINSKIQQFINKINCRLDIGKGNAFCCILNQNSKKKFEGRLQKLCALCSKKYQP